MDFRDLSEAMSDVGKIEAVSSCVGMHPATLTTKPRNKDNRNQSVLVQIAKIQLRKLSHVERDERSKTNPAYSVRRNYLSKNCPKEKQSSGY